MIGYPIPRPLYAPPNIMCSPVASDTPVSGPRSTNQRARRSRACSDMSQNARSNPRQSALGRFDRSRSPPSWIVDWRSRRAPDRCGAAAGG